MTAATLPRTHTEGRREDLRLAELVGFLAGYPTLDALDLVRLAEDTDPIARVARALVQISATHAREAIR
jgi:hypothetical protein